MREVVNINDGKRLGAVRDIDINLEEGRIQSIILMGHNGSKVMNFWGKDGEITIPWEKIVRIGIDVILVDLPIPQAPLNPSKDDRFF